MTRISSYDIYQCPDCEQQHILPNYASISFTPAVDALVSDADLRVCFGCGSIKTFEQFIYVGRKGKPRPDFTPFYVKFIKRLFSITQPDVEPHPTRVYPYLNSSGQKPN